VTEFVWGVDCGAATVTIAAVPRAAGKARVRGVSVGSQTGARRLALLHQHTTDLAGRLAESHPPLAVFVEQPAGRPNPPLMAGWGVIRAAVYATLETLADHPVSVFDVMATEWKRAIGVQQTGKDRCRREGIEYPVSAWARDQGYLAHTVDYADALGIAAAGNVLLTT
jgi:hypothetical protein